MTPMNYETAIEKVYGNGLFLIYLTLCFASFSIILAYEFQSIVFLNFSPKFNCSDSRILRASRVTWITKSQNDALLAGRALPLSPDGDTSGLGQCYAAISGADGGGGDVRAFGCSNFTYDGSAMLSSVVTDYDLVCDERVWANWLTSATMIAVAVGHFMAIFTDRFSRRRVLLFYMVMEIFWSLVTPFASSLVWIFICRIMRMLSMPLCYYTTGLLYELLPAGKRTVYGNCYWIPFCVGYMLTAGLAYLTREWRVFRLYGLLGLIGYIPLFFILPESPRWLILNGKYEEYRKTLAKLAKWNKVSLPEEFVDKAVPEPLSTKAVPSSQSVEKSENLLDVFHSPNVRCGLLIFCVQLSAVSTSYYGLSTSANFAADNVFLNVFYMGLSEVPSSIVGWLICHLFNRRNSFIFAASSVIPALLIAPLVRPHSPLANTLIIIFGKLMVTVAYNICLLHVTEFFPTTVRNMGLFFVMAFGCSLSSLSPFINDLYSLYTYLPSIIYAGLNLIAIILTFIFLPDTKNCPLAQTISQAELLRRGHERQWREALHCTTHEASTPPPTSMFSDVERNHSRCCISPSYLVTDCPL